MPASEPYTAGEIARAIENFGKSLVRIETKLDARPLWQDITRMTDAQKRIDDKQDAAINELEATVSKLLFTAVTSAIGALVSLAVAVMGFALGS